MTTKNKKGFTIIEVVLVLAIAGLIFLMVFIALPALQRSQRNTQREDDISRFLTAISDYQTNNSGKTPFQNKDEGGFTKRYIDDKCTVDASDARKVTASSCDAQFTDPDGTQYVDHKIYVYQAAGCGATEGSVEYYAGARNVALLYVEEGGAVICNDNH